MKRIKFLRDVTYETEGVGRGPTFRAGSEHELRDDLADRWLRREVASLVLAGDDLAAVEDAQRAAEPPDEEAPAAESDMHNEPEQPAPSRRLRR